MCQRTAFEIVKGFDTSLGRCEDYDLYLRMTRDHPIFCHNQFVADYRLHNLTRSVEHSLMLQDTLSALAGQWDFVKGSHRYIEALKIGKKYWQDRYRRLEIAGRVPQIVEANLPSHATVAVATGGKNELLKLGGRRAWHFPQAGTNERGRLFQQGSEGSADVPWIEAGMRYEFHLFGGPEYSKELAALSVIGLADADLRINDIGSIPAGQVYLVAAPNPVPAPNRFGRTTITWNTGDGTEGRVYLSEGGAYESCDPRDSDEAISHLEAIRARGAEYLLLPATAFWWLDRYQRFREYLEARCPVIVRDKNICFIFDLVGTTRARKIDRQTPIVVADPDRTIEG